VTGQQLTNNQSKSMSDGSITNKLEQVNQIGTSKSVINKPAQAPTVEGRLQEASEFNTYPSS
jgi:hypothetical protein